LSPSVAQRPVRFRCGSGAAVRFDLPVVTVRRRRDGAGSVLGADAYTPAALHQRNPGFLHSLAHGVEAGYALMGPCCRPARAVHHEQADVAGGAWEDGRVATVQSMRQGRPGLGYAAFTKQQTTAATGRPYSYRELLERLGRVTETRQSPVANGDLVEVGAFRGRRTRRWPAGGSGSGPLSERSVGNAGVAHSPA
jgi:hypothetical protein